MQFRNIIGQERIKKEVIQFIEKERIHPTQLFLSKTGTGVLPFALAYAQYLLCESPTGQDSCGECSQCRKMSQLIHPDVHFTIPTIPKKAGDKPISDEYASEFRTFVQQQPYGELKDWLNFIKAGNKQGNITARECAEIIKKAKYRTVEGKYKIYIIWMAEALAKEGNRLLKILEEPPKDTVFLLLAENEELILNTILSRCQITRLQSIQNNKLAEHLAKNAHIDNEQAKRIAIIANGNINLGLKLAENDENEESILAKWLQIIVKNPAGIMQFTEALSTESKENLKNLMHHGAQFCRETVILQDTDLGSSLPEQEKKIAQWLSKKLGLEQIAQLSNLFEKANYAIERNANLKLLLMNLSLEIGSIITQRGN